MSGGAVLSWIGTIALLIVSYSSPVPGYSRSFALLLL